MEAEAKVIPSSKTIKKDKGGKKKKVAIVMK